MKHNQILTVSILGGILLLAAGCVKEKSNDDIYRPVGSEIIFGAATEYENGDGTRTQYSGNVSSGATRYERINWMPDDNMKIYYAVDGTNVQNAVYNVDGAGSASGTKSLVGISAAGSTKLTWGSGSSHRFRAVYPSSASFDGTNVGGSIPAAQVMTHNSAQSNTSQRRYLPDMSHAYMVSQLTVPSSSTTSRVDLPFTPAMTAFQFRFKVPSGYNNINISSVVLSTESVDGTAPAIPLAGNFSFAITGEVANVGADWTKTQAASNLSSTKNEITVTFGGNVALQTSDFLDFTVLALPIPISGLKVTVNYVGGTSKTLKLKKSGNWVSFDACKKYVITNENVPGGEIWDYYIDEIPNVITYGHSAITSTDVFTYVVKSYRQKRGTSIIEPVAWHMEYSTDKGEHYYETWPSTSTSYSALTTTSGSGYDGTTYQSGNSTLPTASQGQTTGGAEDATRAALATATPRGTSTNAFDLSRHRCYGNKDEEVARNTANCYIVSAPGYYKFPLVYGNGIKNNDDNTVAYSPEEITHIYETYKDTENKHLLYLTHFKNALNEDITSPYILTDLGSSVSSLNAAIIWQDVPTGEEIIKYDAVGIEGSGENAYITFYISADDIRQGNIVIALRGNATGLTGNDNILWSWHIWVTEKDILNPIGSDGVTPMPTAVAYHYPYSPSAITTTMARFNLGWTDKTDASSTKWPDRRLDLKIVQNVSGGAERTFYFRQVGDSKHVDSNIGSNLFYQWGRKDPVIPAAGNDINKSLSTGTKLDGSHYVLEQSDHKTPNLSSISKSTMDYATGIRNPHIMYKNALTTGWVGGPTGLIKSNGIAVGGTDEARTNSSIPYNLWNAYGRHQAGKDAMGKAKTIYDPCPPGFTVPDTYAFTRFAGNCIYSWASIPQNYPYHKNGSEGNEGVNFNLSGTSNSGGTIYFPYTGARGYENGEIYDVKKTGYYWTDCPDKSNYDPFDNGSQITDIYGNKIKDKSGQRMAKMMFFDRYNNENTNGYVSPQADLFKGAAYSIRPVLEE